MNSNADKVCSCGGSNPNCYKCDGSGFILQIKKDLPKTYFSRVIRGPGETPPEEIKKRSILEENERKLAEENLERNKTLHNQTATNNRSQDNSKSRTFIYSKNNSDISKNWTKQSKPSFQCTKCSYKWNRDPLAKCAWCNEFGPYEKHNQILN